MDPKLDNSRAHRMDRIDHYASYIFKFFTFFAIIASAYVVVATTVNVISRYAFSNNINGTIETSELAMSLISFGALPIVSLYAGHIKVDLIVEKFSKLGQNIVTTVNNIICGGAMVYLSFYTYKKCLRTFAQGICTNSTRILHWPFYAFIALMLMFSAICCFYNVVHMGVTGSTVNSETFKNVNAKYKEKKALKKEAKAE